MTDHESSEQSDPDFDLDVDEAMAIAQSVDEGRLRRAIEVIRSEELDQQELEYREYSGAVGYPSLLRLVGDSFLARETFEPGDLVMWKPHLKNRQRPAYGSPAFVVEVLDAPARTDPEINDINVAEQLDLRLGVLLNENRFTVYHFDSRRFTAFEPPIG